MRRAECPECCFVYIRTLPVLLQLTARGRVLLEVLLVAHLVTEYRDFYGNRSLIAILASAVNCPYNEPHQPSPNPHTEFL
jgi:hypothetical protein